MTIADDFIYAKRVTHYEKDATGATALWPTDKIYKVECPGGKRWLFIGGYIGRAVSSTCNVHLYNAGDAKIIVLAEQAAAATAFGYPKDSSSYSWGTPLIIDAGEYISAVFGTSQDANTYASCIVLELTV